MQCNPALFLVTSAGIAACLSGCLEREGTAIGPNIGYGQEIAVGGSGVSTVDVLFVIDNSGSMREEQENLALEIPSLVRDLASPPDRNGDGRPDWNPTERLRIGIATTDVGTGSVSIEGSYCVPGGDDGALHGGVFEWSSGDDPDRFAGRVRTEVRTLGIQGCAFEQPLETAARVVARAGESGFPGEEGLFAVIVVTDEEDCSVEDDDAFFSAAVRREYNVFCARQSHELTPVADLVAAIRGERTEDRFVFAAIAGVPRDLPSGISPSAILARGDMAYREVNATDGLRLEAVCELLDDEGALIGRADPARRLVEVATEVPGSVLTTICTEDFGPAIDQIGARIGERVPGVCLVRELPRGAGPDAPVPCEAVVTLPAGEHCEDFPGYRSIGEDPEGPSRCKVAQVSPTEPSGFYYDPGTDGCPQLVLTEDARPPIGAELRVECFFSVYKELGEQCARNTQCATGYCDRIERVCAPFPAVSGASPPAGPSP